MYVRKMNCLVIFTERCNTLWCYIVELQILTEHKAGEKTTLTQPTLSSYLCWRGPRAGRGVFHIWHQCKCWTFPPPIPYCLQNPYCFFSPSLPLPYFSADIIYGIPIPALFTLLLCICLSLVVENGSNGKRSLVSFGINMWRGCCWLAGLSVDRSALSTLCSQHSVTNSKSRRL